MTFKVKRGKGRSVTYQSKSFNSAPTSSLSWSESYKCTLIQDVINYHLTDTTLIFWYFIWCWQTPESGANEMIKFRQWFKKSFTKFQIFHRESAWTRQSEGGLVVGNRGNKVRQMSALLRTIMLLWTYWHTHFYTAADNSLHAWSGCLQADVSALIRVQYNLDYHRCSLHRICRMRLCSIWEGECKDEITASFNLVVVV